MEEKIILAALEEMKVHGFRFTMGDLTRRLHMSKTFLYKQIDSKEKLVAGILNYLMAKFEHEEKLISESELPLTEKLSCFVRAYAKTFQFLDHGIYNDLQSSYPQEWVRWENFRRQKVEVFLRRIREGIDKEIFRPINLAVVERFLLVMSSSLAEPSFLRENDLTYAQAIESLSDWMFHGIVKK